MRDNTTEQLDSASPRHMQPEAATVETEPMRSNAGRVTIESDHPDLDAGLLAAELGL